MNNPIGIANNSLIIEDKSIINLNLDNCKSNHCAISGSSGVGKSALVGAIIFSLIKSSILEQLESNNNKESNSFLLLDPTGSDNLIIISLIEEYITNKNISNINLVEYSKQKKEGNKEGLIINKEIIINPLFNKKLIEDLSFLDITVNFVINGLKGMIGETSAFGGRNTPVLKVLIKSFILFNIENYNNGIENIYSMQDINDFLDDLIENKRINKEIMNEFNKIINSKDENIRYLSSGLYNKVKKMIKNLTKDATFYETTITKIEIFSGDFGKTFGYGKKINELTFDYYDFIMNKKSNTEVLLFDLELFSIDERKAFHGFLNSSSEVYGNLRNYKNPNLGNIYVFLEEFQSFLEIKNNTKDYSILALENILNQRRKHKINYTFIMQFVTNEMKNLLNNIGIAFIFALPPEQANLFINKLKNGVDGDINITDKDVGNLNRGEYFAIFDSINNGLCTVSGKSFDLGNQSHRKILLS